MNTQHTIVFFPLTMRLLLIIAILSIKLLHSAVIVHGDVGTASPYGPPYTPTQCNGNSQDQFPPGNMFASVGPGLWDNGAACGRRYKVRCLSGTNYRPCKYDATIQVQVVDGCSADSCNVNLFLSRDAFAALSRFPNGKINIEYTEI